MIEDRYQGLRDAVQAALFVVYNAAFFCPKYFFLMLITINEVEILSVLRNNTLLTKNGHNAYTNTLRKDVFI